MFQYCTVLIPEPNPGTITIQHVGISNENFLQYKQTADYRTNASKTSFCAKFTGHFNH